MPSAAHIQYGYDIMGFEVVERVNFPNKFASTQTETIRKNRNHFKEFCVGGKNNDESTRYTVKM